MAVAIPLGVPRIIHQTWKDARPPTAKGDPESWRRLNPGWEYRLWTDEDLLAFMTREWPELLDMYLAYSRPVQRADLARYCLLRRFGGVYADIDTRCLSPLEPLAGDPRVVLCEEPPEHFEPALARGLGRMFFNGTMASPPDHPFWDDVIALCRTMFPRRDGDVLETTGPLLLTAAVLQWPTQDRLSLNSCHCFARLTAAGSDSSAVPSGCYGDTVFSEHLWQGSWYKRRRELIHTRTLGRARRALHQFTARPTLSFAEASRAIDVDLLTRPLHDVGSHPRIAILIPARDAASCLRANFSALRGLDYPLDRITVIYGVGESTDGTEDIVADLLREHGTRFAGMRSVAASSGTRAPPHDRRWWPKFQRRRRAGIARARNTLMREALAEPVDWFLWLDADVVGLPSDLIQRLLEAESKIVVPDCVLEPGGPSYDLNAFLEVGTPTVATYYRHCRYGLFQPPARYWERRHLDDLRYLHRTPLHGVGGTALFVHGDVHRAGLGFPEIPYRDLLETEAFGILARDCGVVPMGLPRVTVIHARV
jgi:GT2 family glycosyltransferase